MQQQQLRHVPLEEVAVVVEQWKKKKQYDVCVVRGSYGDPESFCHDFCFEFCCDFGSYHDGDGDGVCVALESQTRIRCCSCWSCDSSCPSCVYCPVPLLTATTTTEAQSVSQSIN